jgi:hypothetical protein
MPTLNTSKEPSTSVAIGAPIRIELSGIAAKRKRSQATSGSAISPVEEYGTANKEAEPSKSARGYEDVLKSVEAMLWPNGK